MREMEVHRAKKTKGQGLFFFCKKTLDKFGGPLTLAAARIFIIPHPQQFVKENL
jgi:hypothetical protein